MFDNILSTQHGLIMESQENVTNYDVHCAQLLTENTVSEEKTLIPVINNVSDKYIKKIDDSFSVLADLTVDTEQITEFFTTIQHTAELEDIPLSTPLKNVNEIGRIKAEYLTQIAKDSAGEINDIVNGKIDMKELMNHFKSDISTKIKKQLVVSNKPITDLKGYMKSQEQPNIVPMDSQAIQTLCIPFLRTFPVKKRELQEEIASVKVAINTVTGLMRSYTDTAVALKSKGQISGKTIDNLNYYLYNQNRLIDELITYMVFSLITKIDTYTFNINSYMELYRKVLKYNPEGSGVYHESVYEYSLASMDIDSTVNMAIHGNVTSLIDWVTRTYDSAKGAYENHRTVKTVNEIDFVLDQYVDNEYPYGDLFDALDRIEDGLDNIPAKVRDKFASPESIMKSIGFEDSLTSRFSMMISSLTDISKYFNALNSGKAKSAVLFEILAEMRSSIKNMEKIGEEFKDVYEEIDEVIEFLERNTDNEIPNELVRMEMLDHLKHIERDYRNFLGVVIQNIIQRGKILEDEVFTLVEALDEQIDATDVNTGTNYNILAVEACMDLDEVFANLFIESEMIKFRNAKFAKEYGFVLEGEQSTTTDKKEETGSPEVKEDPTKQSEADVKQNNDAAEQGKSKEIQNDPEKKKSLSDKFKELMEKINGFFNKIIPDFLKGVTAQLQSNKEFLEQYKDSVLGRSFNGLTLNIYNYFNLSSQSILDDIGKVSAAVSQITDANLAEYANPETLQQKLFGFLKPMKDMTFDDFVRIYYKVGPNQKEVKKIAISNTELKNRTTEMVTFCEDYYTNNGYNTVKTDIEALKNALNTKIDSFKTKEITDEQSKALQAISREVMVFTGAVLTGFRNRAQHYMFAIRKLVPKGAKPKTAENQNAGGNENTPEPTSEGEPATT